VILSGACPASPARVVAEPGYRGFATQLSSSDCLRALASEVRTKPKYRFGDHFETAKNVVAGGSITPPIGPRGRMI